MRLVRGLFTVVLNLLALVLFLALLPLVVGLGILVCVFMGAGYFLRDCRS